MFSLILSKTLAQPLQAQLTTALRNLLLSGPNYSGARLPASRPLSQELSVSRTTVTVAYDQLISEGYLTTRIGGGTFVADHLPHLNAPVSRKGQTRDTPKNWLPFHPGVPDQKMFPHKEWSRHLERVWSRPSDDLLARPDPLGWYPLREAISDHLSAWRGLECCPEQILITAGASEAFEIIFRGLLGADQTAVIKDPGWPSLRDVLVTTGTKVHPIRVDDQGFDAAQIDIKASVAIVTPSRHYPTGKAMPLARRTRLLEWANRENALVIEDDYDSEFRYQGHPLPSLTGLDGLKRSIYLGSFSKLLSPALRIGYLVLPETHVPAARTYLSRYGARASLIPQPALANFLSSGEFAIHLRRMRRTYVKRQAHLISELSSLCDAFEVSPDPSGMHICAPLTEKLARQITDREISLMGPEHGLHLRALSSHAILPNAPQGLILGFAAFNEQTLTNGVKKLTKLLTKFNF